MVSVIIPVLNECQALPGTLAALLRQGGHYEIVVVDGGSTDSTPELAAAIENVRLICSGKGRGVQMNAGARVAQGEWLLFLHADTRLPGCALAHLESLASGARCEGGAFRHRFAQRHWLLDLISIGNNIRCRLTRIYYGDQAMFVKAATFRQLGGFPEDGMLEDVRFSERLRRAGPTLLVPDPVITDARRFMEFGILRTFLRALLILSCHKLRLPLPGRGFRETVR